MPVGLKVFQFYSRVAQLSVASGKMRVMLPNKQVTENSRTL